MWDTPADIELRHLRAFAAVAEDLSFTAAAKRLFIAQQALSVQIRQLEQRLGVQLLHRTTRVVELTEAGRVFAPYVRSILDDVGCAINAVRAEHGVQAPLVVGFATPLEHERITEALEQWADLHPDANVKLVHGDPLDPSGGLRNGQVDVAFVSGQFDCRGLELLPLFTEELGVAMSSDHPLAARQTVTVDEFARQPTFWFPTPDDEWRRFWDASNHRNGHTPEYRAEYRSLDALISLLRAGQGVRMATRQLVASFGSPGTIAWRPVPGLGSVQHSLARRGGDERPAVRGFFDVVRGLFATAAPAGEDRSR